MQGDPLFEACLEHDHNHSPHQVGSSSSNATTTTMPHPDLKPFFIIDTSTGERVVPNSFERPHNLENEYFTGHMMAIVRTSDVDTKPTNKKRRSGYCKKNDENFPEETTTSVSSYLKGRKRRFEFQFQIRLKKIPTGRVYFACELRHHATKLEGIKQALVGAAMGFVKATNRNFHFCIRGEGGERPHMAFPVEQGMDRVIVTPAGETPPTLGTELVEAPESMKRRKNGECIRWNLEDTFTLSLWSAYVDFLSWRCINLPAMKPFKLSDILGRQPVLLSLYELQEESKEHHYRCDLNPIVELEMSHCRESGLGDAAQTWVTAQQESRALDRDGPALVGSGGCRVQGQVDVTLTPQRPEA